MLTFSYDREAAAAVLVFSRRLTVDDIDAVYDVLHKLRGSAEQKGKGIACIAMGDVAIHCPHADVRQKIAARRSAYTYSPPIHLAVVVPSMVLRGVLTAVNLISPPKAGFFIETASTFDRALLWCADQRGEFLPVMRSLHKKVSGELAQAAHAVAA